jgi:hypothetical protein
MDNLKDEKQLSHEAHVNAHFLYDEYARRLGSAAETVDADGNDTDKFHEDAVEELTRRGHNRVDADFIVSRSDSYDPDEMFDYCDKKTIVEYLSVLRTLANRIHAKLPDPE